MQSFWLVVGVLHLDRRLLFETRGQVEVVGLLFVAVYVHLLDRLVNALVQTRPLLRRGLVRQIDFLRGFVRDLLTLPWRSRHLGHQSVERLLEFEVASFDGNVWGAVEIATLGHLGN